MQVVIDIPETYYEYCKKLEDAIEIQLAVKNGTPLPKGHGRLFDEQDIVNSNYEIIGNRIYELEPIIEADKDK